MKPILACLLLVVLLVACTLAGSPATPARPTGPTPARTFTPGQGPTTTFTPRAATPETRKETVHVIQFSFHIRNSAKVSPEVDAGSSFVLEMQAEPVILSVVRRADGSVYSVSTQPWANPPVRQMRLCISQDLPCAAGRGGLQPFESNYGSEVNVNWLGPRSFILTAEFFDAAGSPLPSVRSGDADPRPLTESTLQVTSVLNPAVPLEKLPSPILTAAAATRMAFPLTGSVLIEGGRCCAGGVAGSQVSLKVEFQAASTAGKVVEMKAQPGSGCIKDPALLQGAWEPFQPSKTYSAGLAINWVGWYLNVQYRDERGNLSPVYCDDISLEGSPPTPKP